MTIKNIIFDMGGVIINIDYHLTTQAFRELGVQDFNFVYCQANQKPLFDDFEVGKISSQEFRVELTTLLGINIAYELLDEAWTRMLLDLPLERLRFIEQLKKNYRTFLFSNINEIHFDKMRKICGVADGTELFGGIFEREYYSHLFGKRKPHKESFQAILDENQLQPSETLFIDDSIQHVRGAEAAGINAIHLTGNKNILDLPEWLSCR